MQADRGNRRAAILWQIILIAVLLNGLGAMAEAAPAAQPPRGRRCQPVHRQGRPAGTALVVRYGRGEKRTSKV